MKEFLVILTIIVILTGLVIGISTSDPEIDATGRFALGGNLGLQLIIIIVAVFTLISVGARFVSEY